MPLLGLAEDRKRTEFSPFFAVQGGRLWLMRVFKILTHKNSDMSRGDYHLIVKHKTLLPTFEDEDDNNSGLKIDVGFEED